MAAAFFTKSAWATKRNSLFLSHLPVFCFIQSVFTEACLYSKQSTRHCPCDASRLEGETGSGYIFRNYEKYKKELEVILLWFRSGLANCSQGAKPTCCLFL